MTCIEECEVLTRIYGLRSIAGTIRVTFEHAHDLRRAVLFAEIQQICTSAIEEIEAKRLAGEAPQVARN
jgi:hypothetical protein